MMIGSRHIRVCHLPRTLPHKSYSLSGVDHFPILKYNSRQDNQANDLRGKMGTGMQTWDLIGYLYTFQFMKNTSGAGK